MIQADEHILFVSQAKVAVLSNCFSYFSLAEGVPQNQHLREENCGDYEKMPIFRIIVQCCPRN